MLDWSGLDSLFSHNWIADISWIGLDSLAWIGLESVTTAWQIYIHWIGLNHLAWIAYSDSVTTGDTCWIRPEARPLALSRLCGRTSCCIRLQCLVWIV